MQKETSQQQWVEAEGLQAHPAKLCSVFRMAFGQMFGLIRVWFIRMNKHIN